MPHRREFAPILSIALGFITWFPQIPSEAPQRQNGIEGKKDKNVTEQLVYKDDRYGFSFLLPTSWKGYRIIVERWSGSVTDEHAVSQRPESGPLIKIRNPRWTSRNPYQDIPIMIFTQAQWKLIESESLVVSGAPFGPSEIGRNTTYVFALPPRYNFGDAEGQDEVNDILQRSPIHALKPR